MGLLYTILLVVSVGIVAGNVSLAELTPLYIDVIAMLPLSLWGMWTWERTERKHEQDYPDAGTPGKREEHLGEGVGRSGPEQPGASEPR